VAGNRKKANARHEPVVDKRPCGLRSYRDNRRGNCGEQVCKNDEDEITFLPLWRPVPLWRLFFFNVSRTKYALFAAAVYAALYSSPFANQIRVYDSLPSEFP
jgi:hypothetical protein